MADEHVTGFEDYIVRNRLVPEKYARYHRLWAERWLASGGAQAGPEADSVRRRFLERLAHGGRTADWQVRQADDAVKLYLWNYLPTLRRTEAGTSAAERDGGRCAPDGTPPVPGPDTLTAMRDELRLRHYTYRTEQTYLAWATRFLDYARQRAGPDGGPGEVSGGAVKDFLTHLALDRSVSASTQNQIYTHVVRELRTPAASPLDLLGERVA